MKRLWKNRGGFTLVEIIVTFTLTAIFMSSAAMVLSTFMRSHAVASAVATEQDVAAIVMDTITGSLDGALYSGYFQSADGFNPEGETKPALSGEAGKKPALLIRNEGGNSVVWYFDEESGNAVKMYLKQEDGKGCLAMDYFVNPGAEAETGAAWEKVPWQLGTGVYQNCSLEKFTVSQVNNTSCLKIEVIIKNPLAGDEHLFTMQRAVDCYNLAPDNIDES